MTCSLLRQSGSALAEQRAAGSALELLVNSSVKRRQQKANAILVKSA